MSRISNPILPGFNPDPSIVRVGPDYYIATSTFEWLPGIQLHHSTDLANWRLVGHVLTASSGLSLRGIPASAGVWAPNLTYDEVTGRFCVVYSIMKNQVGEMFDVDNYLVSAPAITGPWSEPIYLTSVGFDASLFHDEDGRTWIVALEWDPRDGYEHPGAIVLQEYLPFAAKADVPRRIHRGTTDRGAIEGPQLFRKDDWYYLITAEGGTGFGHGVALARSKTIEGPYEPDAGSPFITSWPTSYNGRNNRDFLRPEFFNPDASLQKAGHGSVVQTPEGEWYVAHLSARPLPETRRSVLGRETSIQKVSWTDDGWLRLAEGGVVAMPTTEGLPTASDLPSDLGIRDDFEGGWNVHLSSPRRPATDETWASLSARRGHLRLRGGDSLFSLFDVSLVATRLRTFDARASTSVDFSPAHFSHSAGLVVYYDNRNWIYLRIYLSESLGGRALGITTARDGEKREHLESRTALPDGVVTLCADLHDGVVQFSWGPGTDRQSIGPKIDASYLSDEFARGFTGTFVGLTAQDAVNREAIADFDFFELTAG